MMKKIFYLLILSVTLVACKSNTKQQPINSTKTTAATQKPNSLADEFKGIINGEWLKKDYIDEIASTRSPLKAWEKVGFITGIVINTDSIKADSLVISINYSFHEGVNSVLKFRKGKAPNTVVMYSVLGLNTDGTTYELGYNIAHGDTALIVYTYNKQGRLINTTHFTRLESNHQASNGVSSGPSYYRINQLAIAGNYKMTDSLGKNLNVLFKANGVIEGLEKFTTYALQIDFMTPPNEADNIELEVNGSKPKTYIFRFKSDTLNFYEPKFDEDSVQLVVDKLKYKLVKQK